MPLHIAEDYAEVQHQITLGTDPEPMFVTYGVFMDTPPMTLVMLNALHDNFVGTLLTIMGAGYSVVACHSFEGTATPGVLNHLEYIEVDASPSASKASPQNCAYLIRKNTAAPGKGKTGRMYLPGVPDEFVNPNGTIQADNIAAVQAAAAAFYAGVNAVADIGFMALFHSDPLIRGGVEVPNPDPVADVITSLTVDGSIGTQRRRLR